MGNETNANRLAAFKSLGEALLQAHSLAIEASLDDPTDERLGLLLDTLADAVTAHAELGGALAASGAEKTEGGASTYAV